MSGLLVTITGPSGVGKSVVVKDIFSRYPFFGEAVSTTTRLPRKGEVEGVAYHFVDRNEFEFRWRTGKFLERVEYNGNFYGIETTAVQKVHDAGKVALLVVEPHGACQIRERWTGPLLQVFMQTPSEEVLRERMEKRGDTPEQIQSRRTLDAKLMREDGFPWGMVVVNKTIQETSDEIVRKVETLRH